MPLELKNVTKRVGAEVHIHETNLIIEEGTFNILLGSTLAGKTTLMRLMAGIQTPTSGSILNDGKDVTGVPVQKRNVSMVYQQFINYPNFSVYENIASPLRVAGWKGPRSTNACVVQLICSGLPRCLSVDRWSCRAVSSREQPSHEQS
jgi:ABC-type sugar transport system ATPase subunit